MKRTFPVSVTASFVAIVFFSLPLFAQSSGQQGAQKSEGSTQGRGPGAGRGPGGGMGRGMGRGFGRGRGQAEQGHEQDNRHEDDHVDFQFLLTHHDQINRTVTETENGVITVTESDDPEIAERIQEHVYWMKQRIKKAQPIRMRDPLFRELFQHTEKIKMEHENTEKGVRVVETSDDPKVAVLIKAHAKVLSGFVERGFAEAMKNHPVPNMAQDDGKTSKENVRSPRIADYGKVNFLPHATHQPQPDTRIVVDVTKGGDPEKLFSSIEKLARFVNIYHAAGKEAHEVDLAVVLHGDATLAVLNADAYAQHFNTKSNPHFDCLHQLHEHGVQIIVCGQSLIGKGHAPEDVVVFADVAVSALTSLANLQKDGFAYVPLK